MKASAQIATVTPPCDIRNKWGEFKLRIFRIQSNERLEDIAALYLNLPSEECLLRINSACITSESFGDVSCDCKWQMDEAIAAVAALGSGLIIYAQNQEGRGIGLFDKVRTMHLMHTQKLSTARAFTALGFETDLRSYEFVLPILNYFEIKRLRLMTNNPSKMDLFDQSSIELVSTVPMVYRGDLSLSEYLNSKKEELGHFIDLGLEVGANDR
jgi:GTP cyclohydrolase II